MNDHVVSHAQFRQCNAMNGFTSFESWEHLIANQYVLVLCWVVLHSPNPHGNDFIMVDLNIRFGPFQISSYQPHPTPTNVLREHQHRGRPLIVQLPSAPERAIPRRSTTSVPERNVSYEAQDLDLDLKSKWFAKTHPKLPLSAIGPPGKKTSASTMGWSSSGPRKTHHYSAAIQDNTTLARTKIHLTWDGSNPGLTVKAQQKHYPPPRPLSRDELDACRERYGLIVHPNLRKCANGSRYSDKVATWCESNMGHKVGDGECWTLAHEALLAIAAQCTSRGQEPCMASQSLIHGHILYSYIPAKSSYPEPRGGVIEAGVARGDVMQFLKAKFRSKDGRSWSSAGDPDHTAVVTEVERDGVLKVVEQNSGGVKKVVQAAYDMEELVEGEVRIFRAVGEWWIGKLDPAW